MDIWGDLSFLSSFNTSKRIARGLKYDAVCTAIIKNHPATGPEPEVETIADAIADAILSSTRYGQKVAATHAILACACVRFKNIIAVLDSVKTKLITRIENISNAEYPREIHDRIQQLKALQEDHDKLEKQMLDDIQSIEAKYQEQDESQLESKRSEINAAEAKYHQSVEPLFAQRREIVAGDESEESGIPNFWCETILNSDTRMDEQIMLQDTKALWYLTDIRYTKGDPEGLKFEFFFKSNPFFKNQVLAKVIRGGVDNGMGTPIDWYPGKCLTRIDVKKGKLVICDECDFSETQDINNLSFFNFFSTPTDEALDSYIGDLLEKKIIPHAVDLFLDRSHNLATIEKLKGAGADA